MKASPEAAVFKRIAIVVNPASGSAGPDSVAEAERILAAAGLHGQVTAPGEAGLVACLQAALDTGPDLLATVAGDGTARAAAELCGPGGPLVAPLPGGTMNMLPNALYGGRDWKTALADILEDGVVKPVSGGVIAGRAFYVAAILGSPALWAEAREAARRGDLSGALMRARAALRRAFSSRLRFRLEGRPRAKAEALALMCPLVSSAMDDDEGYLEAAAIDPGGGAGDLPAGLPRRARGLALRPDRGGHPHPSRHRLGLRSHPRRAGRRAHTAGADRQLPVQAGGLPRARPA